MRIVDSHHHIWRRADLHWLSGTMQARVFGAYNALRRDYLMSEYQEDIAGSGVVRSVYVQANWPAHRFEDEVAWVQTVAGRTGWPHAIVGFADLTTEDARPQCDLLAAYPLMRGINQQFHWHKNAGYRFARTAEMARDPRVQRNVARLADYGWSFDLQVFAGQMEGAAELAAGAPGVTIVLQHAGMPEDTSEAGLESWHAAMTLLAAQPNVVVKLSGLGTFIRRNNPAHVARIVRATVEIFGPDRCLFGSNFPIEKIWTTFPDLLAAYVAATAEYSEADRNAIFSRNAQRVYRLPDM